MKRIKRELERDGIFFIGKISLILVMFILLLGYFTRLLTAAPILGNIKLDHFGYRTADQKIAYFTANPGASVGVYDANTNALVYTTTNITSKGTDTSSPLISGDTLWWVDFSGFLTPGQYYLLSTSLNEQSYNFQISDCIYQAPMTATLKALYYQRCGVAKPAAYAGANWADTAPCHTGDAACGPAPGCTFPVNYGTLNLSGGWHDAGDYNKYIGSAPCNSWGGDGGSTMHYLLTAYEWNPGLFPDNMTNIPESGNGISDLLDECKWELDWYLKMQMTDKHVLSVVHQTEYTTGSPPSTDPTVRYYAPPTSSSEAEFVAMLSLAARVMSGVPALNSYAMTLKSAAEATWNSYETTWAAGDQKFWAAAEIFRMENALGGSAAIISAAQAIIDGYKTWNGLWLNENQEQLNWGMLAYMQSTGATAAVVTNMKADWGNLVGDIFTQNDLYNSGMHSYDYFWGANEIKMDYGMDLISGVLLGATGTHTANQCLQHAEDFLHYMNGSNPVNMTFMTNSAALGASHGVWRIYHSWFGNYGVAFSFNNFMGKPSSVVDPLYPYYSGTDNYGISDSGSSTYGPPPGIVPDGPSNDYYNDGGKSIPPILPGGAQPPYEKDYRDWNYSDPTGGETMPWIINETGIYYISSYMIMASAFTSSCSAATATPTNTYTSTKTVTPTNTPQMSATPTFTRTATATASPTGTYTRTATPSLTLTLTLTSTPTCTATFTSTVSPTATATRTATTGNTATNTPVNTATFTITVSPTSTAIATNTRTNTFTNTPTGTGTFTVSLTQSPSFTPTSTRTTTPSITITLTLTSISTGTPTYTRTITNTYTETPNYSPTNSVTGTPPTVTFTPTITVTYTDTGTFTNTATGTSTPSMTVTSTRTASPSVTSTASQTPSPSASASATASMASSVTASPSVSPSFTLTSTKTTTPSVTLTLTLTPTLTGTPTYTKTQPPSSTTTAVSTPSPTTSFTFTPTATATAGAEGTVFEVKDVVIYPNPVFATQNMFYVNLNISRTPQSVMMKIYTAAFRAIRNIEWTTGIKRGDNSLSVPVWKLGQIGNGTYYYVIIAKDMEGQTARSKAGEFIIIR